MKVSVASDFKNLLPRHTAIELGELKQACLDDPDHKTMPPVYIWEEKRGNWIIVDGHTQHDIRTKNKLKVNYRKVVFDSRDEAIEFALKVQLGRRNLSTSQKAAAYSSMPKKPVGRPAKQPEGDNDANLQDIESEGYSDQELAELAGVSPRTINDARKVHELGSTSLKHALRDGDISASDAVAVLELPKARQSALLDKALKQGKTLRQVAPKKRKSKATDFDPKELEKSNGRKIGKEIVPAKLRKEMKDTFGKLQRLLTKAGISEDVRQQMKEVLQAINHA